MSIDRQEDTSPRHLGALPPRALQVDLEALDDFALWRRAGFNFDARIAQSLREDATCSTDTLVGAGLDWLRADLLERETRDLVTMHACLGAVTDIDQVIGKRPSTTPLPTSILGRKLTELIGDRAIAQLQREVEDVAQVMCYNLALNRQDETAWA